MSGNKFPVHAFLIRGEAFHLEYCVFVHVFSLFVSYGFPLETKLCLKTGHGKWKIHMTWVSLDSDLMLIPPPPPKVFHMSPYVCFFF